MAGWEDRQELGKRLSGVVKAYEMSVQKTTLLDVGMNMYKHTHIDM